MNRLIQEFKPFSSDLGMNMFSYALLTLLTIYLSCFYFLESVKRIPMKFERFNLCVSSFIQTLFLSFPAFIFHSQFFSSQSQYVSCVNGSHLLIVSGFSVTFLAFCLSRKLLMEKAVLYKVIGLSLITANSCMLTLLDFEYKLYIQILFLILAIIGMIIQFRLVLGSVAEPVSSFSLNESWAKEVFSYLLFPFELFFENVLIIPNTRTKKYTCNIFVKAILSPLFFTILLVTYFNISWSLPIFLISGLICSSISSFLILCHSKNPSILLSYGLTSICLLFGLIFSSLLQISINISEIMNVSKYIAIPLLLSPVISIPSISIQTHFIKAGFHLRTLLSIFYFLISNLILSNTFQSLIFNQREYYYYLKPSYICIITLIGLLFFEIIRNKMKFTPTCGYYGLYAIIQEFVLLFTVQ